MKVQAGSLIATRSAFACTAAFTSAEDVAPEPPESAAHETTTPFLLKPYLQLGHAPPPGKLVLVYRVTGAGGQHLYNPEQQDDFAS